MPYMTRQKVCERLRLGLRQSYRLIGGAGRSHLLDAEKIISALNRAHRPAARIDFVPSDMATPEEAVETAGLEGVTPRMLTTWCRRTRNAPPHFRFNGHTIRFRTSELAAWAGGRA